MAFDQAAVNALFDAVRTHALELGVFSAVATHEAKSKPNYGVSCEIWVNELSPLPQFSGLAETAALVVFHVRIRSSFMAKPEDDTDKRLMAAVSALIAEYSGHFTLSGLAVAVDLLGMHGQPLGAQAGYLEQDGTLFRVMTVTLPIVLDNVWTQGA
jgi:hypothetical protein